MRNKEEISISFDSGEVAEKTKKTPWAFVYEWLDSLIYAIILILIVFTFFFRVVSVNGISMVPTLSDGDWLTVSAVTPEIDYGDIVVITQPNTLGEPIVKRVIAKGGDKIEIDLDHNVKVNGVVLVENYIATPTSPVGDYSYSSLTVPEGCLFVMGDNRDFSLDSRYREIGFIDERYVLGVAQVRIYPYGEWKIGNDK